METQKITIPENSKVSIENGVIIIESNEPKEIKYNFKRGDILESDNEVLIFDEFAEEKIEFKSLAVKRYYHDDSEWSDGWYSICFKPASEKSKQLLFDHLKSKGKRWNSEKMVVEDVLKVGDLVIGWDGEDYKSAGIYVYTGMAGDGINYNTNRVYWEHAVKFESIEQYKKILKGEI